ncbi:DUF6461 domain-containing protein [Streptomyces sp. NPDC003691]
MGDGIQWLVGAASWLMAGLVFARGIGAEELAVRMGGKAGEGSEPLTAARVSELPLEFYRPASRGDGVVRVGEHAGWSFAIEYGDSTGRDRLEEISRSGVEAVHYDPSVEHPPAYLFYARDGRVLCGFGLCEEAVRYGAEPDLFLPDLVAAGILHTDGVTYGDPEPEDFDACRRRTLAVVESRFGLSLPRSVLTTAPLPAYAVSGSPNLGPGPRA